MKGAEAHTVSESDRIRFTQMLVDFREDPGRESLTMPSDLTNTERKFLHSLAGQLGLKSKSSGKGENRRITVSRPSTAKRVAGGSGANAAGGSGGGDDADDSGLPVLRVGRRGLDALRAYRRRHPPTAVEEAESRLTGSSLLHASASASASTGARRNNNATSHNDNNGGDDDDVDDDDAGDDVVMTLAADAGTTASAAATAARVQQQQQQEDKEAEGQAVSILQALDELHISSPTSRSTVHRARRKTVDIPKRVALHRAAQTAKAGSRQFQQMRDGRRKLPAWNYRKEVCDVVHGNRVTILSGDTGWYVLVRARFRFLFSYCVPG
jgi:hypothetical protein